MTWAVLALFVCLAIAGGRLIWKETQRQKRERESERVLGDDGY
jgi:hypothetical protein